MIHITQVFSANSWISMTEFLSIEHRALYIHSKPALATADAGTFLAITLQLLQLESCSHHLRLRHVF